MYKRTTMKSGKIHQNLSVEGQTIEKKIEKMIAGKEPIKNGAPLIFTERKEGVRASTNIRTDRFLIAVEAADKIEKSYKARREERHNPKPQEGEGKTTGTPDGGKSA